jgi:type IV pilus assembly protein PilA
MIKNDNNKKKKRGFTLIELIIVIAIIAILAAIAIPKFGEVRKKANISADIANAKQIQGAVSTVIADGTVDLPTGGVEFTFDGTAENGDKIETAIKEQLQDSIPKLKAVDKGSNFFVTVSAEGKTTITTKKGGEQVYPQPATGTGAYVEK